MIQLDVRVRTPHARKFEGGVVGWWVADTNYLYPASWGWIKNTIKISSGSQTHQNAHSGKTTLFIFILVRLQASYLPKISLLG